ncbi:hypothetical protein HK102_007561, partial [Quaeritorhiza haematococci]
TLLSTAKHIVTHHHTHRRSRSWRLYEAMLRVGELLLFASDTDSPRVVGLSGGVRVDAMGHAVVEGPAVPAPTTATTGTLAPSYTNPLPLLKSITTISFSPLDYSLALTRYRGRLLGYDVREESPISEAYTTFLVQAPTIGLTGGWYLSLVAQVGMAGHAMGVNVPEQVEVRVPEVGCTVLVSFAAGVIYELADGVDISLTSTPWDVKRAVITRLHDLVTCPQERDHESELVSDIQRLLESGRGRNPHRGPSDAEHENPHDSEDVHMHMDGRDGTGCGVEGGRLLSADLAEGFPYLQLCWRRFQRLDWIVGEDERGSEECLILGPQILEKTHVLELRRIHHEDETIELSDGTYLQMPHPIEGYLKLHHAHSFLSSILPTRHHHHTSRTRYFATHDQFLVFFRPKHANVRTNPPVQHLTVQAAAGVSGAAVGTGSRGVEGVEAAPMHLVGVVENSEKELAGRWRKVKGMIDLVEVVAVESGDIREKRGVGRGWGAGTGGERYDFFLRMRSGAVVCLQAFSSASRDLWISHLTALSHYWKHRMTQRLHHRIANKQANLVYEEMSNWDQHPEIVADPRIWSWCLWRGCRFVQMSGPLYLKLDPHSRIFKSYTCVLIPDLLLIFSHEPIRSSILDSLDSICSCIPGSACLRQPCGKHTTYSGSQKQEESSVYHLHAVVELHSQTHVYGGEMDLRTEEMVSEGVEAVPKAYWFPDEEEDGCGDKWGADGEEGTGNKADRGVGGKVDEGDADAHDVGGEGGGVFVEDDTDESDNDSDSSSVSRDESDSHSDQHSQDRSTPTPTPGAPYPEDQKPPSITEQPTAAEP